jgi:PKD repeat protein
MLQGQTLDSRTNLDSLFSSRGEIYFSTQAGSPRDLAILSSVVSIAGMRQGVLHAFASRQEFETFISLGYRAEIAHMEVPANLRMMDVHEMGIKNDWDYYPTYEAYEAMMYAFEEQYPSLCRIVTIGTLPSGRKLLAAKISDQVDSSEGEPQFLYTSSIHGNETGGYILMLRLIDHLLSGHLSDPSLTWLVDNLEIWINPLANPDGTYAGGNNSVAGATRYNSNFVDLNRNYPDPEDGPHPDGNQWQPETQAFMQFASEHHFAMGANFHGGTELVNYPWDTWQKRHADDAWWQYVSYQYADTVHAFSGGYFYGEGDGVTNGYDWYTISGGRQDYMTHFHRGRECTIEISDEYIYPPAQLPNLWEYNYRSFLNYMRQCAFGASGTVSDTVTGEPLTARIWIDGHDFDSSHVYSCLPAGDFHRLLYAGTYELDFRAQGYFPKTLTVQVVNEQATILSVEMVPGELIADFHASDRTIVPGSIVQFTDDSYGSIQSWNWVFEGGNPSVSTQQSPLVMYYQPGEYSVALTVSDGINTNTLTRTTYIRAATEYPMQNGTFTTCTGMFYDNGGENGHYGNNRNLVMTFFPDQSDKKLTALFTSFSVEPDPACAYDWLKIYDGPDVNAPLIGEYCGLNSPGRVTATGEEGALTFGFHSDAYTNESGWTAEISCGVNVSGDLMSPAEGRISLYPNPVLDKLQVRFDPPLEGRIRYRIFRSDGTLIHDDALGETVEKTIDTRDLGPGVYFLEVSWEKGRVFRKLIAY